MADPAPPQLPAVDLVFLLLAGLAIYGAWQHRRLGSKPELLAFVGLMTALSLTVLTNVVADLATSVPLKLAAYNFTNAVLVPVSVYALLWFALAYSHNTRWITSRTVGIAAGTVLLASTVLLVDPEFMYAVHGLTTKGPVTVLGVTFDEWVTLDRTLKWPFRLLQIYAYTFILASAVILVRYVVRNQTDLSLGQIAALLLGILTPPLANSLLFFGVLPAEFDLTDVSFAVTGLAFAVAIFRYRMLDVAPVGRRQLVDGLRDPVVMLDENRRVVDSNPAAREVLSIPDRWRGTPASDVFDDFPIPMTRIVEGDSTAGTVQVDRDGTDRFYEVQSSPIQTEGQTAGTLIALRDVTDLKIQERELKRQNDSLEQFASVVSHDLRNPLTVAQGRVDLAREDCESEHLEAAATGIDRSLDLIADLLMLARGGQDVSDMERIDLATVAAISWESVDTAAADLDAEVQLTIRADRSRLRQVLENLFRNAVEHGGEDVTVTVAGMADGFAVADEGPGIPEADRETVFEQGYSESEKGTGFGLSIVETIADAHGWDVRITESVSGGARFEITGVDVVDS
jgi:signal transduction histidine kinase